MTSTQPVGREAGMAQAPERCRALVIDDSESVRTVLRRMLEEESVPVIEATSGAEALDRMRCDPSIGVVFLDMNMPGMSGLEVLRIVRSEPELANIPIVVLTGGSANGVIAAKDLGAAGWLQKPVRLEAIVNVARNFLVREAE